MSEFDSIAVVVPDSRDVPGPATTESVRHMVTVIEEVAGLSTRVVPFPFGYLDQPHTTAQDCLAGCGAVVVANAGPEHAHTVRDLVDVPVLTDQDTTAIALTARVLATLAQQGRAPREGRVVIAGADTLPILCPVLMAAEIGDITTWTRHDAFAFPLHRVATDMHVVVDLLNAWSVTEADASPVVIAPELDRDALLALPGLLRALTGTPGVRLDVAVRHACALALVMATPFDTQVPARPDEALADLVAGAAVRACHPPAPLPHDLSSRHRAE